MWTNETFSIMFEDLPQPAMLFEPNQGNFAYVTCNLQYELLSPHYRFYPLVSALNEVAAHMDNVILRPVKHADSYWQAEYQPIISNGKLKAVICLWNKLPDAYAPHELKTPITVSHMHLQAALNGTNNIKDNTMPSAHYK
jgi:hypothetical protein